MDSLEQKFKKLMKAKPFVFEDIDKLLSTEETRADYLWFERKIVVELKTLKCDPSYRIQEEVEKLEPFEEPNWKRIYYNVTRVIEKDVRSANKQIKNTKQLLGLSPNTIGLLVFINEDIKIFTPETLYNRISQLLHIRNNNGEFHCSNIHFVWIIGETHYIPLKTPTKGIPSILIESPFAKSIDTDWFEAAMDYVQDDWARHNNMRFSKLNGYREITDEYFIINFIS